MNHFLHAHIQPVQTRVLDILMCACEDGCLLACMQRIVQQMALSLHKVEASPNDPRFWPRLEVSFSTFCCTSMCNL